MKLAILEPVLLPGGKAGKPGDVVDVSETAAWNIISVGRGRAVREPASEPAAPEPKRVEVREPKGEVRDPILPKGGKRKD